MPIATKPPALLKHYPMVQVRKGAHDSFSSSLIAAASFAKDQKIAPLEGFTISPRPTYLTVQIKEDVHVDLNSDFVYMNHSCDPNVTIDLRQMAYVACKDIREGDELFFFYPSTEWSMDQPFACWCHSEKCLKYIAGAKSLDKSVLRDFFVNEHILQLQKKNQKH